MHPVPVRLKLKEPLVIGRKLLKSNPGASKRAAWHQIPIKRCRWHVLCYFHAKEHITICGSQVEHLVEILNSTSCKSWTQQQEHDVSKNNLSTNSVLSGRIVFRFCNVYKLRQTYQSINQSICLWDCQLHIQSSVQHIFLTLQRWKTIMKWLFYHVKHGNCIQKQRKPDKLWRPNQFCSRLFLCSQQNNVSSMVQTGSTVTAPIHYALCNKLT